jgi:hypothetical protein
MWFRLKSMEAILNIPSSAICTFCGHKITSPETVGWFKSNISKVGLVYESHLERPKIPNTYTMPFSFEIEETYD